MKTGSIHLVMLALLIITSCSDEDFLEHKPPFQSTANLYNTKDGAEMALYGIYDILQHQEDVVRFEMLGSYCSPDAHFTGEPGGNDSPYQRVYQIFIQGDGFQRDRASLNYWQKMFKGIKDCNYLISALSDPEYDGKITQDVRERLIAEGYFLRGMFEFKLLLIFGGLPQLQEDFNNQLLGLPFFDHIPAPEEYYSERPSLNSSWERVISDFSKGVANLPGRSEMAISETGRATRGAAKSMLAKSYLYTENWQLAFENAREVIESGQYWLTGEPGHEGPFFITRTSSEGEVTVPVPALKWIFQPEGENHGGVIFSIQYHTDHSYRYPEGQEGSAEPQCFGPRAALIWDPESNDFVSRDLFWGLYQPTPFFLHTAYEEAGSVAGDGTILDPRYTYTIISQGDSIPYYYTDDSLRANLPDSVLYDAWYQWPGTGMSQWKYFADPVFWLETTYPGDFPHDYQYFRFADLLLMAAEAAYHVGSIDLALEYTNRVRRRARMSGNTGHPQDLTSISLEAIYAERRVELAMEGHAFFDIVRTGRAKSELMRAANSEFNVITHPEHEWLYTSQRGENFVTGRHEIFPIPLDEIENSQGRLVQNPGYRP